MNTERDSSSQKRLEKAFQALQAAERLQRDRLTWGLDQVNLDVDGGDGDWLEDWDEDEEDLGNETNHQVGEEVEPEVIKSGNSRLFTEEFHPLTPQEQQEAIERVAAWVKDDPDAEAVRTQYLTLVENRGTLQQKQACIAQTASWLQSHTDAASVREKYLILLGKIGTLQQQQEAIAQTATWLQSHPDAQYVREQYLVLLGKIGTPQQQQEAITQTVTWLQSHPEDRYVRAKYLILVGKVGTPQQQQEAITQTAAWLQSHPGDRYVQQQMSNLKQYIAERLKTDPEFADGFETGYAEFKQTVLREIAEEIEAARVAASRTRVKLGQWFQHIFEPEWQAAFAFRSTDDSNNGAIIEREKLIDLGVQPDGSHCLVVLVATLTKEADGKVGIRLQVYPTQSQPDLPPDLQLSVLSDIAEKTAQPKDNYIRLPKLKGIPGERFSVQVSLGDISVTEDFEI
jgi:hypothetical protein